MKRAQEITPANSEEERLRGFDLREIDAPDARSHFALKYVGRLEAVLAAVRRETPAGGVVLEAGCSQANASLLLAEAGFRAVALDLLPAALGYARKKCQGGRFWPLCGRLEALPLRPGACDAVYLGEVIEHCAHPVEAVRAVAQCLKPGGVMVVTTMNGEWAGSPDPTYSQVQGREVEARQHGRGGEDHLFAFTRRELLEVVQQAGLQVVRTELHATALHSDRVWALKRVLPAAWIRALSRVVCGLPLVGRLTALTLLVVARKEG